MNFFDTKNFSIRREIVKRFLETNPSKQTTSVEKTTIYDFSVKTLKISCSEVTVKLLSKKNLS